MRLALTWERAINDILIYGDSRSSALRHEVSLPLPDSIVYGERGSSRFIFVGALDIPRMQPLGGGSSLPEKALHAVAAGMTGGGLNRIACEHLAAGGHPTRLDLAGPGFAAARSRTSYS